MRCFSYGFEVPPFSEPLTLAPHAKSHGWTSQNSAHQSRRPRLTDQKCWTLGHEGLGSWGFVLAPVPMQDGSDQKANYIQLQYKGQGFPYALISFTIWCIPKSTWHQKELGLKSSRVLRTWHFTWFVLHQSYSYTPMAHQRYNGVLIFRL